MKKHDKLENGGYLQKYFTQIPNIIDDSNLSPHEFRVLIHYYRVGNCWEGVRTTAKKCKMSIGKVSSVRQSLKEKGYITISENNDFEGSVTIRVVDKAKENLEYYQSDDSSDSCVHDVNDPFTGEEGVFTDDIKKRSPDEHKNNPIKNNQLRIRESEEQLFLEKKEKFKRQVFAAGQTIYTKQMLENFFGYWAEPNGARAKKMKWEKERDTEGWDIERRLRTWANNNFDKIVCLLTDEQRTIEEKKKAFTLQLAAYSDRYHKDILNGFFREWASPENIPNPKFLKWELEKFWDIGNRLAQYAQNHSRPKFHQQTQR